MRFPYIAAACVIVFAGCSAPQPGAGTPSPSPPASAGPEARPSAPPSTESPAPASTATPSESGTSSPVASARPESSAPVKTPAPLVLPPNAPPQIVNLELNKTVVQSGDTVSGTIETSSNVASVEARIANYSINVPKVGPGKFALTYAVPNIPFFLKRTYDMVVIARNTAGVETTRTIPITIH